MEMMILQSKNSKEHHKQELVQYSTNVVSKDLQNSLLGSANLIEQGKRLLSEEKVNARFGMILDHLLHKVNFMLHHINGIIDLNLIRTDQFKHEIGHFDIRNTFN